MLRITVRMIIRDFSNRKVRTTLTLLGVAIGIAMMVTLGAISEGTSVQLRESFSEMADIMVSPSKGFAMGNRMDESYLQIVRSYPEVRTASAYLGGMMFVNGDISLVVGAEAQIFSVISVELGKGKMPNWSRREAVLGFAAAREMDLSVDDRIEISSGGDEAESFEVVGILERGGSFFDSYVFIPLAYMQNMTGYLGQVSFVLVELKRQDLEADFERRVESEFPGLEVSSPESMMRSIDKILGFVNAVLLAVSGVALLVGGTSVAATMMTSVVERTREIGIFKALGATNERILGIFMLQSFLLCLFGGILGVYLSLAITPIIEAWVSEAAGFTFRAIFSPKLVLGALALAEVIGFVSGLAPALKASRTQPVEALRYE